MQLKEETNTKLYHPIMLVIIIHPWRYKFY